MVELQQTHHWISKESTVQGEATLVMLSECILFGPHSAEGTRSLEKLTLEYVYFRHSHSYGQFMKISIHDLFCKRLLDLDPQWRPSFTFAQVTRHVSGRSSVGRRMSDLAPQRRERWDCDLIVGYQSVFKYFNSILFIFIYCF